MEKDTLLNINPCLEKWQAKNLKASQDFEPGEILVGFQDGVLKEDAEKIIAGHNLETKSTTEIGEAIAVTVTVPAGSEFEWICRLEAEEKVEYSEPNFIASLL